MARRYQLAIFLARPERRFADQIGDGRVGGQDFVAVAGLAGAILDQLFDAALVEVGHALVIA
ncbi:hypothetical protein D3C83_303900 [compost metagenome]